MKAQRIYETVAEDFEQVNRVIFSRLTSSVPLVEKIGEYIVSSGGKRLRPLLVLLCTRALDAAGENQLKLATIIEFLHTATLLHDDVVDTSDLRRGKVTANARWGNAPSVLVGDFLYSRAFQMMVEIDSMEIMRVLSEATAIIAEGEVLQLVNCRNPDLSEEQYMEVIRNKTAMLFQAASHSAGLLAGAEPETVNALRDYGLHLGLAFQLVDDVLDYSGNADEMGKNVGDDLAEGKNTLPLIHAMAHSDRAERTLIRKAIRQGGLDQLGAVCDIVARSGALTYTLDRARTEVDHAKTCLEALPGSTYRNALAELAELAVDRNI